MPKSDAFTRTRARFASLIAAALLSALAVGSAAAQGRVDASGPPEIFVHGPNAPSYARQQDRIAQVIMTDPRITGAQLWVPWSAVDNGSGTYDWSFAEQAAAPWVRAGKLVSFSFYGAEERTTWNYNGVPGTPKYVLDRVDKIHCNVAGEPQLPNVPVYFEPGYADNYKKFITAAVRHFENDPHVAYLHFGLGAGDESYPADKLDQDPACRAAWAAKGLSFERWRDYTFGLIDHMGSLHSKKRIFVTFNALGSFDKKGGGGPAYPAIIANAAARYGFTVGNEGFGFNYRFNDLYRQMAGRTPLFMQTGSVARINDHAKFQEILNTARQLGIHTFELYVAVWLIANDPTHPDHERFGAMYRDALSSVNRPMTAGPR